MGTTLTNRSIDPTPLPYPLKGILGGGETLLFDCTPAQLRGAVPGIQKIFNIAETPKSGPYSTENDPGLSTLEPNTDSKSNKRLIINSQNGAYALVQKDEETGVESTSAGAVNFTAGPLAIGTQIPVYQAGAGQITIVASGVTLRAPDGAKSGAQYKFLMLWWRTATEVVITGSAAT